MNPPFLPGIRSLTDRYDLFVVDLWGTLHDGVTPYPGAIDALRRLKKAGKHVALLSNAPRRAALAEEMLAALGVTPDLYAAVMTSGESVYTALRDRSDAWHRRLHGPCWHLGPARDRSVFEGLDIELLENPGGAGFCVATGTKFDPETVDDYKPELDRALRLGLPMICANPDIVVPVGDALVTCAGAFAEYYVRNGGDVFWHGKPHRPIYDILFARLEKDVGMPVDRARTIAIGDGLHTDIAGAVAAGTSSALLIGGVHRPVLRVSWRGRPHKAALGILLEEAEAKPDYILPRLTW